MNQVSREDGGLCLWDAWATLWRFSIDSPESFNSKAETGSSATKKSLSS